MALDANVVGGEEPKQSEGGSNIQSNMTGERDDKKKNPETTQTYNAKKINNNKKKHFWNQ